MNLDFKCMPGDLIFVRTRAMRVGINDLTPTNFQRARWNYLATDDYCNWSNYDNEHMTLCLVVSTIKFPTEANNLNYLALLTSTCIAYVFDDPQNGFWIDAEVLSDDPKAPHPCTRGVNPGTFEGAVDLTAASLHAWNKRVGSRLFVRAAYAALAARVE